MAKKRGGKKKIIKIGTSPTLLNKKSIIFMLILVLLLILIIYFAIKTWPIMQERLGDKDNDGIRNYQDKCMSTPEGAIVDSYGCEITEEGVHKESPTYIKEKEDEGAEEEISVLCSDTDGGKDIWERGTCDDGDEQTDYCEVDFGEKLYEYECVDNFCNKQKIYCDDYNALCYDGRCIDKNKDTDDDGYPDLEEYEEGTDPNNPDDYPGHIVIQSDCSSLCLGLGYIKGTGPYDSMGHCTYPEVGVYLSGSSGDVCCCKDCDKWCKSRGWNYGTVTTKANCNTYATNYYDDDLGCCCHMETETGEGQDEDDSDKIAKCAMHGDAMGLSYEYLPNMNSGTECNNYAISKCGSKGVANWQWESIDKCCLWSCKETLTDEQRCQQFMNSKGYDHWILGDSGGMHSSTGCYDYAFTKCYNLGKPDATSAYDSTLDCCIWKCEEGVEQSVCTDYDASAGDIIAQSKVGEVCKDEVIGYVNDHCIDGTHLKEARCDSNQQKCEYVRVACSVGEICTTNKFGFGYCKTTTKTCTDSDANVPGLESMQTKGYCTNDGGVTKNWDTCVNKKLREWVCSATGLCEFNDIDCNEWFEFGYCRDGTCKSLKEEGYPYLNDERCESRCNNGYWDYWYIENNIDYCKGISTRLCTEVLSGYSGAIYSFYDDTPYPCCCWKCS